MDAVLISQYLTDKDKVRLIKINHDFYDRRFLIKFFSMRLKTKTDTDITNFTCYLIMGERVIIKMKNMLQNVTMLHIKTLRACDMSCCLNVTKMYIQNLMCILPDHHTPPNLRETIVAKMDISESSGINRFTRTITKIKYGIHLSSSYVENNLFECYKANYLFIIFVGTVIETKCLAKNVTHLKISTSTDLNLDLFTDSNIKFLTIYTSDISIKLSTPFVSLFDLKIFSDSAINTCGIKKRCLPNLKHVFIGACDLNKDYSFVANLKTFYIKSALDIIFPSTEHIITYFIDMESCLIPNGLKALSFSECVSPDFNCIANVDFLETGISFYLEYKSYIRLKKNCVLCLTADETPNINHCELYVNQKYIVILGMYFITLELGDNVEHVIVIDYPDQEMNFKFPRGLKLFASDSNLPHNLPETVEEVFFDQDNDLHKLKRFNNLKRFGCNQISKIKAKEYYDVDDVYDLMLELYPEIYFKTSMYFNLL